MPQLQRRGVGACRTPARHRGPQPQPQPQRGQQQRGGAGNRVEIGAEPQVRRVRPHQHEHDRHRRGGQRGARRDTPDQTDRQQTGEHQHAEHQHQLGRARRQHPPRGQLIGHEQQHRRQHAEVRVPVPVVIRVIPEQLHAIGQQPAARGRIVRILHGLQRRIHRQIHPYAPVDQRVGHPAVLFEVIGVRVRLAETERGRIRGQLRG